MRAARITSYDAPLSVQTVEEPKLIPGSVIVRVSTTFIPSYTNIVFDGTSPWHKLPALPTTPGFGAVGYIEDVGEGVFDLTKGQLVVFGNQMYTNNPSSKDDSFFIGWTTVGPHGERLQKIYKEGSLAEKVLVPSSAVVPIPQTLASQYSLSKLGVLSFIGISYGALIRGDFRAGQVVIVNGATGLLGSSVVDMALSFGASRVIAVGRDTNTLETIRSLDPKRVFPVSLNDDDHAKKIASLAAEGDYPINEGAHLFIDLIGVVKNADATLACLKALRRRGIAVLVGGVPSLPTPYPYVMVKQLDIRGSFMYTDDALGELIRLVAGGVLDLTKYNIHSFSLDEVNEAVAQAAKQKGFNWVMVELDKK